MGALSTPKMIHFGKTAGDYSCAKYITENDIRISCMENKENGNQKIRFYGGRLRDLRERMGITQEELSQAVHDMIKDGKPGSQSHISNLENSSGEKLPSVQVLWALAVILKTNMDYFVGITDNERFYGDMEDEVVVTVEDPKERRLIQELAETVADASPEDKEYIASLVYRILPKKPRFIE